jgi:hypothetical protein
MLASTLFLFLDLFTSVLQISLLGPTIQMHSAFSDIKILHE